MWISTLGNYSTHIEQCFNSLSAILLTFDFLTILRLALGKEQIPSNEDAFLAVFISLKLPA